MYEHVNENLLTEMVEIGRIDGYKILVYGSEGSIPHFHIENKEADFYCCVKILENSYFSHGKYKDRLASAQRKKLQKFLSSKHRFFGKFGFTNYQIICVYWNDNNPDYLIDTEMNMPNYEELSTNTTCHTKKHLQYWRRMIRKESKVGNTSCKK